MKIECSRKNGGCGATFPVDDELVDRKNRYMQCPVCGKQSKNPLYNGK